jgi:hypothetical protein
LSDLEELSKDRVAKKIPEIRNAIMEHCQSWNKNDAVVGLLCLEDALDNLNQNIGASLLHESADSRTSDLEKTALLRSLGSRFLLISKALSMILELGKDEPSQLDCFPEIEFAINSDKYAVGDTLRLARGDSYWIGTLRMLGKIEIGMGLKIRRALGTIRETVVLGLWDLLQLMSTYHLLNTAIRLDTSLTVAKGDTVPRVNYAPSMTPEDLLSMEGTSSRKALQSARFAAEWSSSDYLEASKSALEAVGFGLDSHVGRSSLEKERQEFFNAYRQFPGFDGVFIQEFGCSVEAFEKVTGGLMRIATPRVHCVYTGSYRRIVQRLHRDTSVSKSEIEQVMRLFLWKPGLPTRFFPILSLRNARIFSLFRVIALTMLVIDGCFDLAYDNNPKGRAFENNCRNLLSESGLGVLPDRFLVDEQVLLDEDSRRLWGKVKNSTDFDVLGSKHRFLIYLECKERRPGPSSIGSRRVTRLENTFEKYHEELLLKGIWLRDNLDRLSGSSCLKTLASDGPKYVLPLVSNLVVGEGDLSQFLTLKELSYFVRKFDFNAVATSDNLIEIPLDTNRRSFVRCLPISYRSNGN